MTTSALVIPAATIQSWRDRLATWAPDTNPQLPRCQYCGLLPMTHREYCPGCGRPS